MNGTRAGISGTWRDQARTVRHATPRHAPSLEKGKKYIFSSNRIVIGKSHKDFIHCLIFWQQDFFEAESRNK